MIKKYKKIDSFKLANKITITYKRILNLFQLRKNLMYTVLNYCIYQNHIKWINLVEIKI